MSGDFAFCYGFLRMRGTKKGAEGESTFGCARRCAWNVRAEAGGLCTSTLRCRSTWTEACGRHSICNLEQNGIRPQTLQSVREQAWKRNGSFRIAGGIRCGSRGCWFRRIARSGPGRARWRRRPRPRACRTIRSATCARESSGRAGRRIRRMKSIFSFVNDYAALLPDAPAATDAPTSPLLVAEPARGLCKVLCFHPDHSLTLARMTRPEIRRVVDAWTREYEELGGAGLDRVRADLRESRGHDGREQSASARADLVHRLCARRAGRRDRGPARAPGPDRPLPAVRLPCRGAGGRRARGFRE